MPTYPGADGTPLHYDDLDHAGSAAPPLVTLAGGAARHPEYLGGLAGLADQRRLVIPHLRGVGRSPMPDDVEAGSFWRQAEDVDGLRRHLALDRVVLLGHSAGTRLALAYAARFPERVAGLVLVTPPSAHLVDVPSDAEEIIARRRGEPAFDAALAALSTGPQTHDDDGLNDWWLRVGPSSYAAWGPREQAHAAVGRTSFAANRAYFSVEPPADLAGRLAAVTAPVLVVAGAEDCGTGLAPVVALAKLFPNGTAAVIEGSGHFPWVEQPTAFRQAVDEFLAALAHR